MWRKLQFFFFPHDVHPDHVKSLDGLRGIAVILVLLSHTSNNNIFFHPALAFNGIGKGGVYLFFILSAYLLDRQIGYAMMHRQANPWFWKRYFIRRFLRIYPLFLISLAFYWGITSAGLETVITDGTRFLHHMLMVDGRSVFWSVPVEFKYYFLSPLILWICNRYLKWDLRATALFFLALSGGMMIMDMWLDLDKISTSKYLVVFLGGTFLALYNLRLSRPFLAGTGKNLLWILGFMALFLCLFLNPNYVGDWMGISVSNNGRKIMLIYVGLCMIMLYGALYDPVYFRKFLEHPVLRVTGVISYSLYLFHMPVIYVLREDILPIPGFLKIYFFIAGTFLLAICTYGLIERPLSRIRFSKVPPSGAKAF